MPRLLVMTVCDDLPAKRAPPSNMKAVSALRRFAMWIRPESPSGGRVLQPSGKLVSCTAAAAMAIATSAQLVEAKHAAEVVAAADGEPLPVDEAVLLRLQLGCQLLRDIVKFSPAAAALAAEQGAAFGLTALLGWAVADCAAAFASGSAARRNKGTACGVLRLAIGDLCAADAGSRVALSGEGEGCRSQTLRKLRAALPVLVVDALRPRSSKLKRH